MNLELLKSKMLRGNSIIIPNVGTLKAYSIGEIIDYGDSQYFVDIFKVIFNLSDIKDQEFIEKANIKSEFQLIVLNSIQDKEYRDYICRVLSMIFDENVSFNPDGLDSFFYIDRIEDERRINSSNFEEIVNIIKLQNGMHVENENKIVDEKTKQLLARRAELRKKLDKAKGIVEDEENGKPFSLESSISILASGGIGVNIFNVYDLSLYAFYNQLNRLKMQDKFRTDIKWLTSGMLKDPDELEIKHWMEEIPDKK